MDPTHYNQTIVTCDGTAQVLFEETFSTTDEGSQSWTLQIKDYMGNVVQELTVVADNVEIVKL